MSQNKLSHKNRWSLAWSIIWTGYIPENFLPEDKVAPGWVEKVNKVLGTVEAVCAKKAYTKLKDQTSVFPNRLNLYQDGAGSAKREQVLEYARQFLTLQGYQDINEWNLNFALEYIVGKEKGVL